MIKRTQSQAQTRASFVIETDRIITCAGRSFTPNDDLAFVKFNLGRAFPVVITDGTALHPQVVANSYRSLEGKVFNLCHLMRSNFPNDEKVQDRILGYIAAVEYPETPAGGWKLQSDPDLAPEITAVAAMFKAATGVEAVLRTWVQGKTLFSNEPWTVSMENWSDPAEGGFLVRPPVGDFGELESFADNTPEDARALGYLYVPAMSAPQELLGCLNTPEDDAADGCEWLRLKRQFRGQETVFLVAGLNGAMRFSGTALTPYGKEPTARVKQMMAGAPMVDLSGEMDALMAAVQQFLGSLKNS